MPCLSSGGTTRPGPRMSEGGDGRLRKHVEREQNRKQPRAMSARHRKSKAQVR
jgi:hypothetical protein